MQKLNNLIKKKYQNSYLNNKEIYQIIKKKLTLIDEIKINIKIKKKNYIKKDYHVSEYFLYLANKKKLTNKDKINILKFYEKFSTHLKLKKIYDKNYKIKTKVEAEPSSYLYLGILILKLKNINFYQKLNLLFKINDISVCKYTYLNNHEKFFLKQNLVAEFRLLKKCL